MARLPPPKRGVELVVNMIAWIFAASGAAALMAALLPGLLSRLPLSEPMVFLGAGVVAWLLIDRLPTPDPIVYGVATEHLTEVCVIIALMGAGLAIDRPVGWRRWGATWRLLAVTMPLTILAVAAIGWWGLGFAPAAAMLLGAALAPTDPVLASDVQVAEPSDDPKQEDEVRLGLTSEAGLNDGLAFPFTYAAVAIGLAGLGPGEWIGGWLLFDVVYRLAVGVAMGIGVGWLLARLIFRRTLGTLLAERGDGFVALAATFLAYGLTELVNGYGFIAVFVCACSIRSSERQHGYHGVMHHFIEQIERLITVVVLVLLGGAIARGLLAPLTWGDAALAAVAAVRDPPRLRLAGAPRVGRHPARTRRDGVLRGPWDRVDLLPGVRHRAARRLCRRRTTVGHRRVRRHGVGGGARHHRAPRDAAGGRQASGAPAGPSARPGRRRGYGRRMKSDRRVAAHAGVPASLSPPSIRRGPMAPVVGARFRVAAGHASRRPSWYEGRQGLSCCRAAARRSSTPRIDQTGSGLVGSPRPNPIDSRRRGLPNRRLVTCSREAASTWVVDEWPSRRGPSPDCCWTPSSHDRPGPGYMRRRSRTAPAWV